MTRKSPMEHTHMSIYCDLRWHTPKGHQLGLDKWSVWLALDGNHLSERPKGASQM